MRLDVIVKRVLINFLCITSLRTRPSDMYYRCAKVWMLLLLIVLVE